MRTATVIIISAIFLSIFSCGRISRMDAVFQAIDRLCDSIPQAAIDSLAAIDPSGLSGRDLYRYHLLQIKTRDKAYIAHTSDTLVLDVIDYYSRHRGEGLYPEALYYGGRVYSDLGDLPTALEFFQKSLDEISEDDANMKFQSTVLNQTGRILSQLRLDSAAIQYLEKSLSLEQKIDNNDYRTAFTHVLISGSYLHQKNIVAARRHMDEAVMLSSGLENNHQRSIRNDFAQLLLWEGKLDSALQVIRTIPTDADSIYLPFSLAISSQIYQSAGLKDTAYIHARKLTLHNNPYCKKTGFSVIFSDELRDYVPKDTLLKLIPEYKQAVEEYLNTNEAEQAIIQNSLYNYRNQIRQREKAESDARTFKIIAYAVIAVVILLFLSIAFWILWHKYRKTRKKSDLMEAIVLTDRLKEETSLKITGDTDTDKVEENMFHGIPDSNLKNHIKAQIQTLQEKPVRSKIDRRILKSDIYTRLKKKADAKDFIGNLEDTLRQLETLVETVSPGFNRRLDILTDWKISNTERTVAMFMKCGFSNTQTASLLSRSASTVSTQRSAIAKKSGVPVSCIDIIIVML